MRTCLLCKLFVRYRLDAFPVIAALALLQPCAPAHAATNPDRAAHITALDIAPVWSGSPVGFSLLTQGGQQYVAFYDAERRMSVAQRTLGERRWHVTVLPSTLGWDSHNYITLALQHKLYGSGTWTVDASTLHLGEKVDTSAAPAEIDAAQLHAADSAASPDALQKQTAGDSGDPVTGGLRYHLEWFTLPQNRDQPRTGPLPPPSTLRLIITNP
jgi:hypothetical protein